MEEWKDIDGFNGIYKVSNYGNVISYAKKTPKLLVGHITPSGYKSVLINYKGLRKQFTVHRLVATYFIENPDNKPYINHIDCNKLNNHYTNLEWCTPQENNIHASNNNLIRKGTNVNTNKLSEEDVLYIYNSNETHRALAKKFSVARSTIYFIKSGKSWGWLTQNE